MASSNNETTTVLADARASLMDRIYSQLRKYDANDPTVHRLTIALPQTDVIRWLTAQASSRRIYWRDRGGNSEVAGLAGVETITASSSSDFDELLAQVTRRTAGADRARYFGGAQFDRWTTEPDWAHFGAVGFMLPRLELERRNDEYTLVCNIVPEIDANRQEQIVAEVERLVDLPAARVPELPSIIRRIDSPESVEWRRVIESTLDAIASGDIAKVALARQSLLTFNGELEPMSLLARLAHESPSCYLFYFQPGRQQAFLGATPEQLFARNGRHVTTEAVAGTRKRGTDDTEDRNLERELINSDKDRREQAAVTTFVSDTLHDLCSRVTVAGERELLKLKRVQHLITRLSGELREGVTDADLLRSLHPTPAVCGHPRDSAREIIDSLEPFERGWYAGPVGWIGGDAAEFAVAIRSARVIGDRAELYAGAGIVDGSTATDEWEEVDAKLNTMLSILGV